MEILLLAGAAGATALAAWLRDRRQGRSRNRQGECAACGHPWKDTSSGDAYLIHGRLVCEECAVRERRRLPWYFSILAVAGAGAAALTAASDGLLAMLLLPLGTTIVLTVGTVQVMKLANRVAKRRIAAGEFPDYQHVQRGLLDAAAPHP